MVGEYRDEMCLYDQQIIGVFRKDIPDAPTTVLNTQNFRDNGYLKHYC